MKLLHKCLIPGYTYPVIDKTSLKCPIQRSHFPTSFFSFSFVPRKRQRYAYLSKLKASFTPQTVQDNKRTSKWQRFDLSLRRSQKMKPEKKKKKWEKKGKKGKKKGVTPPSARPLSKKRKNMEKIMFYEV